MRRALALVAVVTAGFLLVPGSAAADTTGTPASGDFSGLIELPNGHRLYLECHGVGTPTVVLEAGLRGRGDMWSLSAVSGNGSGVLPTVAGLTHVCTYDRPGTLLGIGLESRSDPVPMPRSTGEVVDDLHALLYTAGVPGPYVLAGASTGGLVARQYAGRYPTEVAGIVLVDAISEAMQWLLGPRRFARYDSYYLQSASPDAARYDDLERIDFYRSFAEVSFGPRARRRLPQVVISNDWGFGVQAGATRRFARLVNRAWNRSQAYLASRGPRITQVIAVGSGHQIAINRPGLVARMVGRLVAAARRR
jgi:pimeloyl-ACP methyl ester carboxylesterase